jgi:hypothetical protein
MMQHSTSAMLRLALESFCRDTLSPLIGRGGSIPAHERRRVHAVVLRRLIPSSYILSSQTVSPATRQDVVNAAELQQESIA